MLREEDDQEMVDAALFDRERIRDYVAFVTGSLRRRRRLVVAVACWIMVLAVIGLATIPRTYHVEARLFVQRSPALAVRGDGPDATAPTRGAVETIRGRDNLVGLIEGTDLLRHWDEHRAPAQRAADALRRLVQSKETDQDRIDAMVERLDKRLVAWTSDGTVAISIDWPDAEMACRLVDIAQQDFLEARYAQEVTALAESLSILRSHAAGLRGDIDKAVAELEKLRSERDSPGSAAAPASPTAPSPPRTGHSGSASKAEVEQLQVTLQGKQRALDDMEESRRHRLAELQTRLAEQRTTYTDNHPVVIDLRQAISAASAPSPQVKALREEIASLRGELGRASGDAGGGSPTAAHGSALTLPAASLQLPSNVLRLEEELREDRDPAIVYARGRLRDAMDKQAALREKVESAQIDLDTAQAAFKYRYSVLTPAQLPKRPVKPNVPLVLLAALIVAILGGMMTAVAADLRSGRLVERWQIERLLDRPILAELEVPRLPKHGAR